MPALRCAAALLCVCLPLLAGPRSGARILDPAGFRAHVELFNRMWPEEVTNAIPDAQAWDWMERNVPWFTCPDRDLEQVYFYRWWAYRKHIRSTPVGFILTEFLKPVKHSTDYNAISCAFGHHLGEGRWIRDPRYIDDYAAFWLRGGENNGLQKRFHQFSGWAAAALYDRWLADHNLEFLRAFFEALRLDYRAWESERLADSGLFWQRDVSDGMEESASAGRRAKNLRPSINSYMFGSAQALAAIARLLDQPGVAAEYDARAASLRQRILERLWNREARFFETLDESGRFVPVRENIGYTPWYFDLPEREPAPERGRGFEEAWKQLLDPQGFDAPFGPTTVERRSPLFRVASSGDDCQWNGPNWPFATTITLKAMANLLNDYPRQTAVTAADYFREFQLYTRTLHIRRDDGTVIPFVDENLNPLTGEWWARALKIRKGTFYGRGDHYNHSGYADLLITGLVGLRPRADDIVEVNPLVPQNIWDWFCLDNLPYHGRTLAILWDRTGARFHRGRGLLVFSDGRRIAARRTLGRLEGRLPAGRTSAPPPPQPRPGR